MLINNCEVKCDMSYVRSVLNGDTDEETVLRAREELALPQVPDSISDHRKPWSENNLGNSSVLVHFDYSDLLRETMSQPESFSRNMLVLLLGEGSYEHYEELMGGADAPIDSQIMSLIGSKTLLEYSKEQKQPAFEKIAINVDVQEITDLSQLNDIDFSDYFCVSILETSNTNKISQNMMNVLAENLATASYTIPLILNFSYSVSISISNMDESSACTVASSWFCATSDIEPQQQVDNFLQAIMGLFFPSGNSSKNIFNDCRQIMNQNFKEFGSGLKGVDAIFSSCNMTTCGSYFPYNQFEETIENQLNGLESLKIRVLPPEFEVAQPRRATETWLFHNLDQLCKDFESGNLDRSLPALIGLHENIDEPGHKAPEGETKQQKIERWATKSASGLGTKKIRRVFTTKREKESEKIDRIIYGGNRSQVKLDYCKNNSIFDELNDSNTLSKNFSPNSKNWDFMRRLFLITDLHRYHADARGIDKHLKSRLNISDSETIKNKVITNLIIEEFAKFQRNGGVIR